MKLSIKRQTIAKRELSQKLKLEQVLIKELRPLFMKMNKAFQLNYARNARIIDFGQYEADIKAVLRKHYERVQKVFTGNVIEMNSMDINAIEKKEIGLIDLGLLAWIANELLFKPEKIIETTQEDARQSVAKAQQEQVQSEGDMTAVTIAAIAVAFNKRKLLGRLKTISITETQSASESAKLIEAQALAGIKPFSIQDDPFALTRPNEEEIEGNTKQWVTVRDTVVRATHVDADRQKVPIDKPFIVGGHEMNMPADSSLGAPIKETINCRCSATYNIGGF